MTFRAIETSPHDGEPFNLYEIANGTAAWRFNTTELEVDHNGDTYTPAQITHTAPVETQELGKSSIKVSIPRDNPVAQMYNAHPPTAVTWVTVYEKHQTDSEVLVSWLGRVTDSELIDGHTCELRCEPITTSIRRMGLRRFYQRQCPHLLYGTSCKVNDALYRVARNITGVSGLSLAIAGDALPVNRFAGGMVTWDSVVGPQYRFITSNSANQLEVNMPILAPTDPFGRGLAVGDVVRFFPGCAHTLTDCIDKFNNLDNYGGFPFTPLNTPFSGSTLY